MAHTCRRGNKTHTYIYSDQGSYEPLAQITADADKGQEREILYYHCDQIGVPQALTDAAGHTVWRGRYGAWGGLEGEEKAEGIHQPLRLQNQYCDEETGLHYNFFRYYDPVLGRFISQDPIGLAGGLNAYRFAPNAQTWVDPLGLSPKCSDAKRAECNKQAEIDEAICRKIPERDRDRRRRCWESVQERYGACVSNRPMPPLVTYRESNWDKYAVPILIGVGVIAFCFLGGEGVCAVAIGGTLATQ